MIMITVQVHILNYNTKNGYKVKPLSNTTDNIVQKTLTIKLINVKYLSINHYLYIY